MAGGPVFPFSATPDGSGDLFPNIHVGGTNGDRTEGLGVADATALDADRTWYLKFKIPTPLPAGTLKLNGVAIANASTGDLIVNPTWASTALTENPDTITKTAEGSTTITFTAADAFKAFSVTLDADTAVDGEILVMNLVVVNTGTTVAVTSTLVVWLEWEGA